MAVRPGELLSLTQAPGLPDGVYEVRMRIPATAGPREPLNFVIDDLPRFEFLPHVVYVAAE